MGNRTLEDLANDPVLQTLGGKPPFTRISPDMAAGLLYISRETLDEMYRNQEIPPLWGETKGKRYYTLGEIETYVVAQETAVRERIRAAHRPSPTTVSGSATMAPLSVRQQKAAGLDGPPLQKGRRPSKHATFDEFAALADTSELWPFALLPSSNDANDAVRPVPLAVALKLPAQEGQGDILLDAGFEWMTVEAYGLLLNKFMEAERMHERQRDLEAIGTEGGKTRERS